MKALKPFMPAAGSVSAKITKTEAKPPLVIQHLVPFRTYSSPTLMAVVLPAPASEPAPGSVSPKEPISEFRIGLK